MSRVVKQPRGKNGNASEERTSMKQLAVKDGCGMISPKVTQQLASKQEVVEETVRGRINHKNQRAQKQKPADVAKEKEDEEDEARGVDVEEGETDKKEQDHQVPQSEEEQEWKWDAEDEHLYPPIRRPTASICFLSVVQRPPSSPQRSEVSSDEEEAVVPNLDLENLQEGEGQPNEQLPVEADNADSDDESQSVLEELPLNFFDVLEEYDGEWPGEDEWPFQLQQLELAVPGTQESPWDLDEQVVPDAGDPDNNAQEEYSDL